MTPREQQMVALLKELTVDGVPPTYDILAWRMGLKSKSGVHRVLHSLAEKGLIALTPRRRQSVRIRNADAERLPFTQMADAVADLMASGKRVTPTAIRRTLVRAYTGGTL